jgi:hypothetical protein
VAFDIEVFIPTLKQRTNNLLCQIHTALNSGLNVRVTLSLPDESYPEIIENLTESELKYIRLIKNVPQGEPSIPIKYCLENIEWGDWLLSVGDDDCILPWGLKHLWDARENVSMVIGQTIGVSRNKHYDFSAWKIGYRIIPCHVSIAFINMRSLEKLPKPWLEIDPLSDFKQIERMSNHFPYKIIPSVVHVQSFANMENLGNEFTKNFMEVYGHML